MMEQKEYLHVYFFSKSSLIMLLDTLNPVKSTSLCKGLAQCLLGQREWASRWFSTSVAPNWCHSSFVIDTMFFALKG